MLKKNKQSKTDIALNAAKNLVLKPKPQKKSHKKQAAFGTLAAAGVAIAVGALAKKDRDAR